VGSKLFSGKSARISAIAATWGRLDAVSGASVRGWFRARLHLVQGQAVTPYRWRERKCHSGKKAFGIAREEKTESKQGELF